ncbi:hypothetical protein CHU93_14350 [Sandarakinorhabdus cyanobacteriorum]|uniref:Uncharacterized protein n=1 Tax=Sandarakinorhabdus cyanobacteriorum TaxID=1981098 RepID=A0A255Y8U4_9SPHN|nr:hypothetical protein [Sandarakinorhabdus cyanobacteriorum]OYQ25015.1 hypothetical protein CHU93_14350 [Sandarakinorhabdus cyanobacteriorum]
MKIALVAILLCGVAVVWFARDDEEPKRLTSETSWNLERFDKRGGKAGDDSAGDKVEFRANTESREMELRLPGGIQGKMRMPDGLGTETKFDLDGIGRYPGARLLSVDMSGGGSRIGRVMLGFLAPGSADAVADWYEKALIAKGRTVARTGNTITGATKDGEPMVIAVEDGPGDIARGRVIITDTD